MLRIFKNIGLFLSVLVLFQSYAMDDKPSPEHLIEKFQKSPKYLVHIGFEKGIPDDNIMKPSSYDPALYFSVNTAFPKTYHMPQLDKCPYVYMMPLTDSVMTKVLSFCPSEVLIADALDMDQKDCYLVAPVGSVKTSFKHMTVVTYEGSMAERNLCVTNTLKQVSVYPIELKLNEFDSWDNHTPAFTTIDNQLVNVNPKPTEIPIKRIYPLGEKFPDCYTDIPCNTLASRGNPVYFNNILNSYPDIPYACPAGCNIYVGWNGKLAEIGHLSALKGCINGYKKNEMEHHRSELINWIEGLSHIDIIAKQNFIKSVKDFK